MGGTAVTVVTGSRDQSVSSVSIYCRVRKGAGSQLVMSCVTTISLWREATASGFIGVAVKLLRLVFTLSTPYFSLCIL